MGSEYSARSWRALVSDGSLIEDPIDDEIVSELIKSVSSRSTKMTETALDG